MSWRDVVAAQQQAQQPQPEQSTQSWRAVVEAQKLLPQGQNAGDIVPDSRVPREPVDINTIGGGAGWGALAKAAFVDDPQTKLKIFAAARGVPESEIPQRFLVDGSQIYFKDEKGTFRPENDQSLLSAQGWKELAASQPAYLPAEVLGTVGGMLGAGLGAAGGPAGVVGGGAAGAGLGFAGGEGYRKVAGNLIFDEPQTVGQNIQDMAVAGTVGALGDIAGRGIGKLVNKVRTRRAVQDVGSLDARTSQEVMDMAKRRFNIDLTPGEATGLESLLQEQWMLAKHPASASAMRQFLTNREPAVRGAVLEYINGIARAASPYKAGIRAFDGVEGYRAALVRARSQATEPLYKQAFAETPEVDVSDIMQSLAAKAKNANGAQKRTLRMIADDISGPEIVTDSGETIMGKPSLEKLQNAKIRIDAMLDQYNKPMADMTSAQRFDRRILAEYKDQIVSLMEEASPTYARAKAVFAEKSAPINQLDDSLLGGFVKRDSEESMRAVEAIFGPKSSPEAVANARQILATADPEGWNNVVRAHLESKFNRLKDLQVNEPQNVGGMFRKAVFGSAQDKAMLRAALSPEQYQGLTDLMGVLDMTSRGFRGQSHTVTAGEALARMKDDAMSEAPALLRIGVQASNIHTLPSRVRQFFINGYTDKHMQRMAEIVTNRDSLRQLMTYTGKLRQADLTKEQRMATLGAFIAYLSSDPANQKQDPVSDQ